MARTYTITKKSVSIAKTSRTVTLNLVYKDGDTELINQDFSGTYYTGEVLASAIKAIRIAMQTAINKFKQEETLFNSAGLTTAVTNMTLEV
jgi:hypothetical protein